MPYKDKQKNREYHRLWSRQRRQEALAAKGGKCNQCGSIEKLELDHINPADKVTHKIWTWAQRKRDVELAKCQILCRKCHKAKTAIQRAKPQNNKGDIQCSKCKQFYPLSGFHKLHNGAYGATSQCRQCRNETNRRRDRRKDQSIPNPRFIR